MATTTPSIPPKITIIDSIPTIDISSNSSIRKKVSQCLSILQIQPSSSSSSSSTAAATTTTAVVEPQGKKNKKKASSKKGHPKIIALRTVHPSAGSKAITVAEIVKRCIADPPTDGSDGNTRKGVWWQYTKLESKLIELPPRKPMVVKEGDTLKQDKKKDDTKPDRNVKDKRKPEPITNANKRKQDGQESRASKRPKLDLSQSQNADSTIKGSALKSNSKKRRRDKSDGTDEDSNDDDDDIPPHLKEKNNLESDDDIPPHLRDATDDMDTDDVPPHLRQSSPDDIPPHLRNSTPGLYSDTKPGFLRDSTPDNEGGGGGSDDIPPHLRGSSPFKGQDGSSTPKPIPTQGEDQTLTSSPPSLSTETPTKSQEEHNSEDKNKDKNSDSDDDDEDEDEDDGYRQFSYLDIEHLPEKHTKRILEDIDEAERNRKKYRAIAIMTIYLSLEKHGDFEKLYGGQTNEGEKKKKQEGKKEGKSK
ncbi:hypothetical protein TWF788_010937 [Orbilia oligospora]|uniref:Uncharacterized protein n=1 Tax=Orbilia oligospora TaxID=2813651 RepID=A0A7C8PE16_ORBOL|nr:hypothetical protein TWF788_010937 [Orbilia oligospora]KAF3196908.1 hypothetical protein TWF679_003873 [Orbilia oligospora]